MLKRIPFGLLAKICITLLLLWGLFKNISPDKFLNALTKLTPYVILTVVTCFCLIQILITQRWSFILRSQKRIFPFFTLIKAVFIGHLFNQGLPSSVGGDIYRIMAIHDQNTPLNISLSSVLLERLIGLLGLGFLSLACIPAEFSVISHSLLLWPVVFTACLFFCLLTALFIFYHISVSKIADHPLLKHLVPFTNLVQVLVRSKMFLSPALGISAAISFLSIFNCTLLLSGLGLPLTLSQSCLVFPVAFVVSSLPISLGGWGVREGILVLMLGVFGISCEQALAFSLLYGFLQFISAAPGLIIWILSLKSSSTAAPSVIL